MNLAPGTHQLISSSGSHVSPSLFSTMIQVPVWPATNSHTEMFIPELRLEVKPLEGDEVIGQSPHERD